MKKCQSFGYVLKIVTLATFLVAPVCHARKLVKCFVRLSNIAYDAGSSIYKNSIRPVKLPRPVIAVGNISMGGRGKTPLTIHLVKKLKAKGKVPVVLTRGYGRQSKVPVHLQPGVTMHPSYIETGDEPLEIFMQAQVDVLIGSNRVENAQRYYANLLKESPEKAQKVVFVLDDGLQHWRIKHDHKMVIYKQSDIDGENLLRQQPRGIESSPNSFELGRDMIKETGLTEEVRSFKSALVLTTRAGVDEYFAFFKRLNPRFVTKNLGDHAVAEKIMKAIIQSDTNDVILGGKEAVKVLTPAQYARFLSDNRVDLVLKGKTYRIHRASLELSIQPRMEESINNMIDELY